MQYYEPIKPHRYPLWVLFFYISASCLFINSLLQLNPHIETCKIINKASRALESKDFTRAKKLYLQLHSLMPHNKKIKINLAKALFKSKDKFDHVLAFNYVKDMKFYHHERTDLMTYIPHEYHNILQP